MIACATMEKIPVKKKEYPVTRPIRKKQYNRA